jgi:O-succinylbenzoic acid--CoA ligase
MMLIRAIISKAKIILYKPLANPFIELNDNIDFIALTPLQLFNVAKKKKNFDKINLAIIGGGEISNQLILELQNISTNCYQTYGMTETISHIAVRNLKNCNDKTPYKCLDNISIDTNQNNQLIINSKQLNLKNLVTNDIIEKVNEKEFVYLGRKDNIINSGGLKINPKMLENEIQKSLHSTNFYIDKIKNEKLGEEVVLIALLDLKLDSLIESINTIKDKNTRPKKVFFTDKLFHNENQKLDRVKSKKYALILNKSFSLAKK